MSVSYDGTDFAGSQVQPNVRTVQGELQSAIDRLGCLNDNLAFAGRTDRGVHAVGQVVSVDIGWHDDWDDLRTALNAVLPRDVSVLSISTAPDRFHARFDARWREYRYRIIEADAPPILDRRFALWRREELDAKLAQGACEIIVGSRPMGTFAGSGKSRELSAEELTRTIFECGWFSADCPERNRHPAAPRRTHELRIVADGFLPNMVRNIVGTVMTVARGDRDREWVQSVIGANDRRAIGAPAPPEGLLFWRVGYENRSSKMTLAGQRSSHDHEIWRGGVACQ